MALNLRERTVYRADEKEGYSLFDEKERRQMINVRKSEV